jgi:hypothetical protein
MREAVVVIEAKTADSVDGLTRRAEEALAQVEPRRYAEGARGAGFPLALCYGVAFPGKRCRVRMRRA